jgi:hypothetical protein
MLQEKYSGEPECRSRAGLINAQTLSRAAVVIAAGLGLAACVGPYDDGYAPYRSQYQSGPSYYYDSGYDQRLGTTYRQYPYTSQDQRRGAYSWWRGTDYSRDRRDFGR